MNWFTVKMIVSNTLFWLICCFGVAFLVRLLPKLIYNQTTYFFKEYSFEKKFYHFIRLNKWKTHLPEWGRVWNFEKRDLKKELNISYIDRFILETQYAELGHVAMALVGFACMFVNPSEYMRMALICSTVNMFIQLPFCLIQRYNRPRLVKLKLKLENKHRENSSLKKNI